MTNNLLKLKKRNLFVSLKSFLLFIFFLDKISSKLLGVIQINRHGARTGGKEFIELSSKYYFGSFSKHLTFSGISQHELLGNYIAEKYIFSKDNNSKILSEDLNPNEIKVISSYHQRAIFSAYGFIKGLYPQSKIKLNFKDERIFPQNFTRNYSNIDFRETDLGIIPPIKDFNLQKKFPEISVQIPSPESDTLFNVKSCKVKIGETKLSLNFLQEESFNEYSEDSIEDLIKKDNLKYNYTDVFPLTEIEILMAVEDLKEKFPIAFSEKNSPGPDKKTFDATFLEKQNAFIKFALFHFKDNFLKLKKSTLVTFNKIQVNKSYQLFFSRSAYNKLLSSRILKEIKNYIIQILKDGLQKGKKEKLKFVLFSGHDFNILSLLITFFDRESLVEAIQNIEMNYNYILPELASSFLIELHRKNIPNEDGILGENKKTFIRLIYNGEEILSSLNKKLPFNNDLRGIELRHFVDFLDKMIDPSVDDMKC